MLRCQCEPAGVWPVQAGTGVPRAPQLALGRCSELVAGSTLLTNDTGSCHGWENAMPLVSINLRKGRPPKVKRAIADAVHAALVANLGAHIPGSLFDLVRLHGTLCVWRPCGIC